MNSTCHLKNLGNLEIKLLTVFVPRFAIAHCRIACSPVFTVTFVGVGRNVGIPSLFFFDSKAERKNRKIAINTQHMIYR